jgi:hypothetical protein
MVSTFQCDFLGSLEVFPVEALNGIFIVDYNKNSKILKSKFKPNLV